MEPAPSIRTRTSTSGREKDTGAGAPAPAPNREKDDGKGTTPAAVQALRSATNLFPRKSLWDGIVEVVGENPADVDRWKRTALAWVACGWNPKNVKGMLEFYVKGELPSTSNARGSPRQLEPAGYGGLRDWMSEEGIDGNV